MKKITQMLLVAASLFSGFVSAQNPFFEVVPYAGAVDPDASKDWTMGWTNFTPKSATYGAPTDLTTLDGMSSSLPTPGELNITTTVTLDASKIYQLQGLIIVRNGGDLVIPEGTLIRCQGDLTSTPVNYASIIVERGGQIHINGTKAKPVVFTSNKAAGNRDRGDWGGILLAGKSPNNQNLDLQMEGFLNIAFDNSLAKSGGTVENDNSGNITYCRIEFAGFPFEANKELNALTFCSVGNAGKYDYIQVSFSGDDSYEWFGGAALCKHLIAWSGTDDDFDTDFGFHGAVQFGIAAKDSAYFDLTWNAPSSASTSEGFETDNDAAGSGKLPLTTACFSNMTMCGPISMGSTWSRGLTTTQKGAFRRGARIRRNSRLSIVNSIFMGYRNVLMYEGDSSYSFSGALNNTFPSKMLFRNNIIVNSDSGYKASSPWKQSSNGLVEVALKDSSTIPAFKTWVMNSSNANRVNQVAYAAGTLLVDPKSKTAPNWQPVSTSIAKTGADFSFALLNNWGTFNSVNTISAISSYNLFPNPANNSAQLTFNSAVKMNASLKITDINGRIVFSNNSTEINNGANYINLQLTNLNSGVYFITLESTNGRLSSRLIVSK